MASASELKMEAQTLARRSCYRQGILSMCAQIRQGFPVFRSCFMIVLKLTVIIYKEVPNTGMVKVRYSEEFGFWVAFETF